MSSGGVAKRAINRGSGSFRHTPRGKAPSLASPAEADGVSRWILEPNFAPQRALVFRFLSEDIAILL
jgi:hypothetical protein